jgi:hypothetical protein
MSFAAYIHDKYEFNTLKSSVRSREGSQMRLKEKDSESCRTTKRCGRMPIEVKSLVREVCVR